MVADIREYIRKPIESFVEEGEIIYIVVAHLRPYNFEILKAFRKLDDALAYKKYYSLTNFRPCVIEELLLE